MKSHQSSSGERTPATAQFADGMTRFINGPIQIVTRFEKSHSAHKVATSLNYIKHQYAEAIEYTGIFENSRGAVLLCGLSSLMGLGYCIFRIDDLAALRGARDAAFPILIFSIFALILLALLLWTIRFELFRPLDEPIIFDRRNRKIYCLFREIKPGLGGLLQRWPMRTISHDWARADVWHTANLVTSGSNVMRYHHLRFVIRKSSADDTIIDTFTVGSTLEMGELTVPVVWEHIRRFMEEGGPHLQPSELPCKPHAATTIFGSMGAVGPFGTGYVKKCREHPVSMTMFHLISPLMLPFNIVFGLCHWLSYRTAFAVQWPAEIMELIGPPLRQENAAGN
jgi:hypothetical protein